MSATETARCILDALTSWSLKHYQIFPGTVLMSVADVREIDEQQQAHRHPHLSLPSTIQIGDTGTIWGHPMKAAALWPGDWELEPPTTKPFRELDL